MKWQGRRQSSNVEDRRGAPAKGAAIGGGLGGAGIIVVIILLLLNYCSGGGIGDISDELINTQITGSFDQSTYQVTPTEDELAQFAKVLFADTEDVWTEYFAANGMEYTYPSLVLYTDFVQSGCGAASAVGDDRIQKQQMGYAIPDTFTHGTSEQRQRWFYKGFITGTLEEGDTFSTNNL